MDLRDFTDAMNQDKVKDALDSIQLLFDHKTKENQELRRELNKTEDEKILELEEEISQLQNQLRDAFTLTKEQWDIRNAIYDEHKVVVNIILFSITPLGTGVDFVYHLNGEEIKVDVTDYTNW